jgi:PiT family inorganic phosphate transporter
MFGLETGVFVLLILCILCACVFEFINGFHDTANAVATVIYTNSLKPQTAVVLSGVLNFTGVFVGGITVAMGIVNLLPIEATMHPNLSVSIALILSILLAAIIWNLGTWYYGIPCSSSHTLIGSILGATLAFSLFDRHNTSLVNWEKAGEIGLSLLISPLFGFALTLILLVILRNVVANQALFEAPKATQVPPIWIRALLILTCSGVSFSHGSNDGQKGVGLLMVILIAIVPTYFALDVTKDAQAVQRITQEIQVSVNKINSTNISLEQKGELTEIKSHLTDLERLASKTNTPLGKEQKILVRRHINHITKNIEKFLKKNPEAFAKKDFTTLKSSNEQLKGYIAYAPFWVVLLISLSLGIGTMIGWKRIVITIGEKIGKEHLTYAQGASSELVAASTIGVSTALGLPVSTTHVLSSGIAGSMVATKGLSNLQGGTIRNIALAWVLTLPVCIGMSMGLFFLFSLSF